MSLSARLFLLAISVVVLVYLFYYFPEKISSPVVVKNSESQVCFDSKCFFVELAKTEDERERGLMDRKGLDEDKGMFFIFDKEDVYPFWMKNTLIPLDIIWINGDNKIVFISQNVQPCKTIVCPVINPGINARYVLEINAGISNELNTKVGNSMRLKLE